MNREQAEDFVAKRSTITVECLPEDAPIVGNASAIDPITDAQIAEQIAFSLGCGNPWAWCCVKVCARYLELESSEYLGCCSYVSEQDYREGGYFEDMVATARSGLVDQLLQIDSALRGTEA
jgi:hypothetical protein